MTPRSTKLSSLPLLLSFTLAGGASALFANDEPTRFGPAEAQAAAIQKVEPVYPKLAHGVKTMSRAEVDAYVDTDGSVYSTIIVLGDPKLVDAAENAAKQWKFTPFIENGKPVRGIARLVFQMQPPTLARR